MQSPADITAPAPKPTSHLNSTLRAMIPLLKELTLLGEYQMTYMAAYQELFSRDYHTLQQLNDALFTFITKTNFSVNLEALYQAAVKDDMGSKLAAQRVEELKQETAWAYSILLGRYKMESAPADIKALVLHALRTCLTKLDLTSHPTASINQAKTLLSNDTSKDGKQEKVLSYILGAPLEQLAPQSAPTVIAAVIAQVRANILAGTQTLFQNITIPPNQIEEVAAQNPKYSRSKGLVRPPIPQPSTSTFLQKTDAQSHQQ